MNKTHSRFSFRPQRGLSLIEVLIALMLGVFLLGGVIQIFIINRQTYRTQENLSRLQEDGRFALDLLNRYVRLAGYLSSETVYSTRYYDQKCEDRIDNVFGQRVYYKGSVPTMPPLAGTNNDSGDAKYKSDTISAAFQSPRKPTTTAGVTDLRLPDCLGNPVGQAGAARDTLANNRFYIATNPATQRLALYCDPVHSDGTDPTPQPLLDGVENMQVRYGRKMAGGNRAYLSANQVTNMREIDTIQVRLLMSTADQINTQPQPYTFDTDDNGIDETITPTDRRSRRVFTSTIALRNTLGCTQ